ncbi:hypothetical protein OEZ86_009312 [Tetradesmus obliquus]|nr:hypothetical protein OEZ86_009312 [Tetradesmus obliquus]
MQQQQLLQQQGPAAGQQLTLDDSLIYQRWNDPQYPYDPLDRTTALQYFEFSPFYDPDSNNFAARQRGLDPANEQVLLQMPPNNTEFQLAQCKEPHLYVVRKQRRTPPANKAEVMQYYYILGPQRYTYQAPSLHAVVNARLRRAMHHVREGFNRFKVDIAPLPKVLREHLREQEALQQRQLERLAAMDTDEDEAAAAAADGAANGVANGAAAADKGGVEAAAAAGGAAAAAAKAVAVPDVLSDAEQEAWVKTDNIIMGVLRRYPQARLPKTKAQLEEEQQAQRQREEAAQAAAKAAADAAAAGKAAKEAAAAAAAAAAAQQQQQEEVLLAAKVA